MTRAKANELRIGWITDPRRGGPDLGFSWGEKCDRSDRWLLHMMLNAKMTDGSTVLDELKARGYDITTLKFSVKKKPNTSSDFWQACDDAAKVVDGWPEWKRQGSVSPSYSGKRSAT